MARSFVLRCAAAFRILGTVLALFLVLLAIAPAAQAASADEYEIRAAMLLNIARFVQWPSWKLDASHPQFQVCLLGNDPTGSYADRFLQHQAIANRPVQVRHLSAADELTPCHLLYISAEESRLLARSRVDLAKAAVLTISEEPNASHPDQIIGLPVIDEHVHIDINLGSAQRSGLEISSRLLRLATVTP